MLYISRIMSRHKVPHRGGSLLQPCTPFVPPKTIVGKHGKLVFCSAELSQFFLGLCQQLTHQKAVSMVYKRGY